MISLFNSKGQHIANFVNNKLFTPSGENIGHFLKTQKIFIDMEGHYLGEILYNNRLLYNIYSTYKSTNFGSYRNFGHIGKYENPSVYATIRLLSGYEDVKTF